MAGTDTIFALSTGRPPTGVAIIRVSGSLAREALLHLFGRVPSPRKAALGDFTGPDGLVIDTGLALYFPGPASFTGEDCAEFHCHGGQAVVAALLSTIDGMAGMRIAEAGEFTQRAFLNGKLDLAEVEGLSDLLAAETETQRRFASETSRGLQSGLYQSWRTRIAKVRARLEAYLDFSDEDDVPDALPEWIWSELDHVSTEIEGHCEGYKAAEIIRDGFKVAIAGPPNAGKSSLINRLAQREVAIVTPLAGTTRDVLEVAVDLEGDKVIFWDTAGLRVTDDEIERIGIDKARARIASADLVLHLIDLTQPMTAERLTSGCPVWRVGTKQDLVSGAGLVEGTTLDQIISSQTGAGIGALLKRIQTEVRASVGRHEGLLPARLRHIQHLQACSESIRLASVGEELATELRSENLRHASDELGRIVGTVDADELLGIIFSTFCIGK